MKPDANQRFRALTWRIDWDDLELGNPDVHDKILRRADSFADAAADTAIIFGTHFRWDFLPYWPILHDLLSEISGVLKERDIRLFDHHSATLVHRFRTKEEIRTALCTKAHHLPWAPSPEAAADWSFHGEKLNSWRMMDARTGGPVWIPQYYAEQFCINHPGFRAAYAEYLKRLVSETGIDGLMCDDMIFFGGFYHCSCKHCRKKLHFELPDASDPSFWGNWDDPRWHEYLAMRRDSIGEFLEFVKAALPPDFPLMSCNTTGAYGGNSNHCGQSIHEFVRGDNIINLELCGENLTGSCRTAEISYQAGAAGKYGRPVIAIGYGSFPDSAGHLWAMNHLAGLSTWFSPAGGRSLPGAVRSLLPDGASAIARAFRFEAAHPELFSEFPEYDCAVYFSETTKYETYFGSCETGASEDYRRLIRELSAVGIRAETVFDFPADPARRPCVVMPSVLVMTEAERRAMYRYLASGGVILRFGPDDPAGFPVRPEKDFASLDWLCHQPFDFYSPPDEWRQLRPGLWYDPARRPGELIDRIRNVMRKDLPGVRAPGFAVSIRGDSIHLLALEYDLKYLKTASPSFRIVCGARAKNTADRISCSVPVSDVFCPLGGSAKIAENGTILLKDIPMYVILKVRREETEEMKDDPPSQKLRRTRR